MPDYRLAHKLFVTGLTTLNKAGARAHFQKFGKVLTVKPMCNLRSISSSGKIQLFGFVTFKGAKALQLALQAGPYFYLAPVTLKVSQTKPCRIVSLNNNVQGISNISSRQQTRQLKHWRNQSGASFAQPCTLADALHEAPKLLDILPPKSWSALSGCNKQLRQLIHSVTKTVHLDHSDSLNDLCKGDWPQLTMVLLPKQFNSWLDFNWKLGHKKSHQVEVMAAIVVAKDFDLDDAAILAVRPKPVKQPAASAPQCKLAPNMMSYLKLPKWSKIETLCLSHSKLGAESMAQLAGISWPKLRTLNVAGNNLDAACTAQLAQGSWPELHHLEASRNQMDAVAIGYLAHGLWPMLEKLDLGSNPLVDAAAITQLSKADWDCWTDLRLDHIRLDAACMHELVQVPGLLQLRDLCLWDCQLTLEGVAELASAFWPQLRELDMHDNALQAEAMTVLATASLPHLHTLNLSHNKLDAAGAKQLAKGNWLRLRCLNLAHNCLDDTAMLHLSRGQWPELQSLALDQNKITATGINLLKAGVWHRLSMLYLDMGSLGAQTWQVLDLQPACMPDLTGTQRLKLVTANRRKVVIWPALRQVQFWAR